MARKHLVAALALGLAFTAGGCGGDDDYDSKAATTGGPPLAVSVTTDFKFAPADLTVKPGDAIKVTNTDGQAHTLTADSVGAFDLTLQPGKDGTITAPEQPGTYPYHCSYHPIMKAQLVVE